ncbi:hypothetical protein FLB_02410 [Flavobacterium succinicans]|uniref:Uncharacterized protein n=1 Tax=Flavobacterium succinicans TaxID=29536 RepID=A0A199XV88_9FLAO|nr:hypothetical protein FLB_02410 [Flavobacterium succinicans]
MKIIGIKKTPAFSSGVFLVVLTGQFLNSFVDDLKILEGQNGYFQIFRFSMK